MKTQSINFKVHQVGQKPAVLIYRDHLLDLNEHFIFRMAEALRNFMPYYTGIKRVSGVQLPYERTITVNRGGISGLVSEIAYKNSLIPSDFGNRLKAIQPAIIHAQFGPDGVRALPIARSLNVPLVVHYRGFDATMHDWHLLQLSRRTRIYIQKRELLKREAALFIAVSEFIRQKLLDRGFPPEKVAVHYTGTDCDFFSPDSTRTREKIALFVGRLIEKKGCAYAIEAMKKVQITLPDIRLVVIGDGPLRLQLERMAGSCLRNYSFLGYQPLHDVYSWMNRARILILPSITGASGNAEGLPNVAVEGHAMGLPIVGFMSGGISEVVVSGQTGFLVKEKDIEGLARVVQNLLEDDDAWEKFSVCGQQRVRTHFNLKRQIIRLEEFYRSLIKPVIH